MTLNEKRRVLLLLAVALPELACKADQVPLVIGAVFCLAVVVTILLSW